MPLRFRQRILTHLSHDTYRPAPAREIAKQLRIEGAERDIFHQAIDQLAEFGEIEVDDRGLVRLPSAGEEVTGTLRVNARGFGFVIPDQKVREGDIFVPPDNLADAVSGDRVRVKLLIRRGRHEKGRGGAAGAGGGGGRDRIGRVIEVIERGQSKFVGVLRKEGKTWVVEPDGRSLRDPVIIRDPHAKNAKAGDKVVIELLHYPSGPYQGEGVILEVLGEAGRPSVETQAVIAAFGLRDHFDEHVLEQARQAARSFDDIDEYLRSHPAPLSLDGGAPPHVREALAEREDLRNEFILTIDPPDAKDFDDAISITHDTASDEWTLGVHIADVSHFVRQGAALDEEARERGNSSYLPRLVLPMLPEVLSNGVCSLQEGVPRFTKSVFITLDSRGKVLAQRLAGTIIQSNKRLTYLEAQALIDGDEKEARKHARTETTYTEELIAALKRMDRLARILRDRRRRDGMITLNLPEVELRYDEEGHVIGVEPEDDAFTHTIIEMFMVEANEALARTFDDLGLPLIRRIHPDPSVGKMEVLQTYARVAGVSLPESPTRRDLQVLLEATRESPAARAIHFAVLRTMTKASYSPALIGHYALASDHYTHFTSPIRRYPDLTVHRAMAAFLERTDNGRRVPGGRKREQLAKDLLLDDRILDEDQLIQLGRHCSETEVTSEEAERELRSFLVMQFLAENHLGDTFTGAVTGVSAGAVFVSIEQYLVEGVVPVSELPGPSRGGDRWRLNDRTHRLHALKSGLSIGMGDEVEIQIVAIDLATRRMDLRVTSLAPASPTRPGRKKPHADPAHGSRKRAEGEGYRRRQKNRGGYKRGRRGRKST